MNQFIKLTVKAMIIGEQMLKFNNISKKPLNMNTVIMYDEINPDLVKDGIFGGSVLEMVNGMKLVVSEKPEDIEKLIEQNYD